MAKLSAGVARRVINPPIGTDLCGYAGRIPGCTDIHDDLHAKALVLSDGRTKAAIVSLDLVGLGADQVAQIRGVASVRSGVPAENMLIGASHTHAGPATQDIRACGYANPEYVSELVGRIIDTIVDASQAMHPAKFGCSSGKSYMSINRRYRTPSGDVQIGENKGGVTDPEVGIWQFADESGKPLVTLFNYACHAVTMGGDNRSVSADWPGAAQRAIQGATGGEAMFLQGCCGNINPGPRGTWDEVENNGRDVAQAVLMALDGLSLRDDAGIRVASKTVSIPLQSPISLAEAERTVRDNAEKLKNRDKLPLHEVHLFQAYHDWAKKIIADGKTVSEVPFEVMRFSVDDAHVIGLPGEVFVEYALSIKKMHPNVMVSAYTNGNVGYVPTRKAFDEGGYEVDQAYKLYAEQKLSPLVESVVLAAAKGVLAE